MEIEWKEDHLLVGQKKYFIETPLALDLFFTKVAWEVAFLPYRLQSFPPPLQERFEKIARGVRFTLSEYSDFGCRVFHNVYKNLLLDKPFTHLSSLQDGYLDIPAIICGAGPSIKKEELQLKKLQDKGLIFAGGSAIKLLKTMGIKPHFAAAVDKVALVDPEAIPFFYQKRVFPQVLQKANGPFLSAPPSPGYPLEEWMDQKLGLPGGTLDSGWNVVNFLIQIARYLGCRPIVLVGVDHTSEQGMVQEDFFLSADWMKEVAALDKKRLYNACKKGLSFGDDVGIVSLKDLDFPTKKFSFAFQTQRIEKGEKRKLLEEIGQSLKRCALGMFEDEPLYTEWLQPLWEVWRPVIFRIGGDPKVHEIAFYQQAIEEHQKVIDEF